MVKVYDMGTYGLYDSEEDDRSRDAAASRAERVAVTALGLQQIEILPHSTAPHPALLNLDVEAFLAKLDD